MLGSEMNPGIFYSIFKVHKEHKDGELPPVRPLHSVKNHWYYIIKDEQ